MGFRVQEKSLVLVEQILQELTLLRTEAEKGKLSTVFFIESIAIPLDTVYYKYSRPSVARTLMTLFQTESLGKNPIAADLG